MIWHTIPSLDLLAEATKNTLASHLGIEIIEIGTDFIKARMPVDQRTRQPAGILHGGASVVLSESVGSMASYIMVSNLPNKTIVGIEVNANHVKSVSEGYVESITKPVKLGRTLHIWQTDIFVPNGDLVCTSRLTVMIIDKKSD